MDWRLQAPSERSSRGELSPCLEQTDRSGPRGSKHVSRQVAPIGADHPPGDVAAADSRGRFRTKGVTDPCRLAAPAQARMRISARQIADAPARRRLQGSTRRSAAVDPGSRGLGHRSSEPEGRRSHPPGKAALCGQIAHAARGQTKARLTAIVLDTHFRSKPKHKKSLRFAGLSIAGAGFEPATFGL
jgi:hypothetical protein